MTTLADRESGVQLSNAQVLAIQSYILSCVKYETAHYLEKSEALLAMVEAQGRMHRKLTGEDDE